MNKRYVWTAWESLTYEWTGLLRALAGPKWRNPVCDVTDRYVCKDTVSESVKMSWPDELKDLRMGCDIPSQVPWQGSVGGQPVQMVNPTKYKTFTVDNVYGGTRIVAGEPDRYYKPGEKYKVKIPVPVTGEWAVQGYPNGKNDGDRHWYGIEPDGTAHEVIWLGIGTPTVASYNKWSPKGERLDSIPRKGSVVKGDIQWTAHAWNRFDEPHRLGIVFYNFGNSPEGWGDGTGEPAKWTFPAYGQILRLSEECYDRLSENADWEQQAFLDSCRYHGIVPFDRGKKEWHGTIAMVSGAQHVGSTIPQLNIPLSELELVVK